jgi:hypothetical protein
MYTYDPECYITNGGFYEATFGVIIFGRSLVLLEPLMPSELYEFVEVKFLFKKRGNFYD